MAKFKYKAIDHLGKFTRGQTEALNIEDLEARLKGMGLDLVNFSTVKIGTSYLSGRKITRQDMITFCFHLQQLANSGVPLIEGLCDLRDSIDNERFKEIISSLIENIQGGKTLSQAMEDFPRVFDKVFLSLIRAGEESGRLGDVLDNIVESLKWQDELAAQTKKIIMYPAFVGTIVTLVVIFLMVYLVPQLVGFITNMGEEIPFHTLALIKTSDFIVGYWYLLISVPVLTFILTVIALNRSPAFRLMFDHIKMRIWIIGPIVRKIILTRFINYFSLLYGSGVTILSSLEITEDIVDNLAISEAIKKVRLQISEGNSISQAMESVTLFPPLVLRMIKVGENTGAIDTALTNVSYFFNREIKESIGKVQSMIEPALTLVMGAILGWVMLSVLGPVYDIISKIKT